MKKTLLVSALLMFPALTFAGGMPMTTTAKVDLDIETATSVKSRTNDRYIDYIGGRDVRGTTMRGGITNYSRVYDNRYTPATASSYSYRTNTSYNPTVYQRNADGRFINMDRTPSSTADYYYYRYGISNPVLDINYDWTQDPDWRANLNWRLDREPSADEVERIIRRIQANRGLAR